MQNCNISHNIRKLIDLINYADEEKLEAVIIALDFEKALTEWKNCHYRSPAVSILNGLYCCIKTSSHVQ